MVQAASTRPAGAFLERKYLVEFALVLAAYVIAGKLGQATANIRSGNLGPVWPAYGIALAAILMRGYRVWPAIALGAFLVAFLSPVLLFTAIGQALGATIAALTGAFLLCEFVRFRPSLSRLSDALTLIVVGGLGSAMVSASIGMASLYLTREHPYAGIGKAWLIYWLGDATGVLLVTPFALTFSGLKILRDHRHTKEFLILVLLLGSVGLTIFGYPASQEIKLDFLAFAVLPFIMWAAIRFGVGVTAFSILIVATIATIETALGSGPFASSTPFMNAVLLDVFFFVISVTGLTLAAVIAERKDAELEREEMVRQQAAVEARLRLATIVESSNDAIISESLNGTIESWNSAAEQMFGYTELEAMGRPLSMLVPPELEEEQRTMLRRLSDGERIVNLETVRVMKNGKKLDVSITLSPIRDTNGRIVGASKIIRDIGERKQAEQMLSRMNRRLLDAQEKERTRIARDLHDDIAQRLALLTVGFEQIQREVPESASEVHAHIRTIQTQAAQIANDVQTLSHELHSSKLEYLGVAVAANGFCKELSNHQKVEIDFRSYDIPSPLSPEISLCLYRVLQESLHNAVKYSGVRRFEVQLWGAAEEIHLKVSDFGIGFSRVDVMNGSGLGLTSMQERVKMVEGQIVIDSQPGRGTTIHARVPLPSTGQPTRAAG
jgi:PAS domain S-box-containing protein